MATKVKLTKTDLKKQKDSLKRYKRYLPTLLLKKQQLQMVIKQIEQNVADKRIEKDSLYSNLNKWIQVFGEEKADIVSLVKIEKIDTDLGNIAGVDIPVFNSLTFLDIPYSLFYTPLWIDSAIVELKKILKTDSELLVLEEQLKLLNAELRTTSQRVNLFEKVKIPDTKFNIRKIQIALGDEQTASVVRGKISKNKVSQRG